MAYQKNVDRGFAFMKYVFILTLFAGLVLAVVAVWFGAPRLANTNDSVVVEQSEPGQIASLSGDQFVAGDNTTAQDSEQSATPAATEEEAANIPHSMNLPSGWTLSNTDTGASPCDPTLDQTIETYVNGSETLTVYVNGSAAGCDNNTIGDVYFDYNYTPDNSGISVDTTPVPPFCTKDQNPTCPKGDGKVTVFVGNQSSTDPNADEPNPKTTKTYYFSIVDSALDADLDAQAASLGKLAEAIVIN